MTFYTSADEPKRPKNGFIRYSIKHRAELLKKYPYKDNRTISKLLGIRWKKMTAEEKQPYVWAWELVYLFYVWECVCVRGGGGGGPYAVPHSGVSRTHCHPRCEMYAEPLSVWDIRSATLRRREPYAAVWAVRSATPRRCEPYAVWAVRSATLCVSRTQCEPYAVPPSVWAVRSATFCVRRTQCEPYAVPPSVWAVRSVSRTQCHLVCEPYAVPPCVWAVRSATLCVSRTQCHLVCEPYAVPPSVWAVRSVSRTQCHLLCEPYAVPPSVWAVRSATPRRCEPYAVWAVRRSILSVKSRTLRHPQNWLKILLLGLVSTSGRSSTTTSTRSGARTPSGATHPPSDPPRSSSTPWTRGCDQGKKSAPRRVLSLFGSLFRMCARTLSVSCDSTSSLWTILLC